MSISSPTASSQTSLMTRAVQSGNGFLGDFISNIQIDRLPEILTSIQKTIQERTKNLFQEHLKDLPSGICLATTGSDARAEKADRDSPMEIIVINSSEDESKESKPVHFSAKPPLSSSIKTVKAVLEQFPEQFDPRIEIKDLENRANPLTFVNEKDPKTRFIPTRAIDAIPIFGDDSAFTRYQKEASEKLLKTNAREKKKFYTDQVKPAEIELQSCLNGQSASVNLKTGELTYDPDKRLKSVKYGLLRCIQYKLAYALIEAVQAGKILSSILLAAPKPVAEKIAFLQEKKILDLSEQEASELVSVYQQVNQWYVVSQIKHQNGIKKTYVDPNELTQSAHTIEKFFSKKNIIK